MPRKQILAVLVGVAVSLLGSEAEVMAAKFNVYYRTSAASPWVYYAGKDTKAAAQTTVGELKELGYLAEIVADGEAAPSTFVAPTPTARVIVPAPVGVVGDGI